MGSLRPGGTVGCRKRGTRWRDLARFSFGEGKDGCCYVRYSHRKGATMKYTTFALIVMSFLIFILASIVNEQTNRAVKVVLDFDDEKISVSVHCDPSQVSEGYLTQGSEHVYYWCVPETKAEQGKASKLQNSRSFRIQRPTDQSAIPVRGRETGGPPPSGPPS